MLQPETTALLVIDVQGKLARIVNESSEVIRNVQRCIQGAQVLNVPIILIEQNPEGLGETVAEVKELLPELSSLSKMTFSCAASDEIMMALAKTGRNQLLVCGIEAHVCVYQSVAGLLQKGYEIELITDAVSSRTAANRQLGIEKMQRLGANLTSTEMCLLELTHDSASPAFRQILPLIK